MDNMEKQKQLDIINIEEQTIRAFFIGFIIAIIPFSVLLLFDFNKSFKLITIIFGIITSLINAFIYRSIINNRLANQFNIKYKKK